MGAAIPHRPSLGSNPPRGRDSPPPHLVARCHWGTLSPRRRSVSGAMPCAGPCRDKYTAAWTFKVRR